LNQVEVLERLTSIMRDVFDNEELVATPSLNAAAVDGWDSMRNVSLLLAIEQDFKVRFGAAEISELRNIGELSELILSKI
jgi:acyl carrier protein